MGSDENCLLVACSTSRAELIEHQHAGTNIMSKFHVNYEAIVVPFANDLKSIFGNLISLLQKLQVANNNKSSSARKSALLDIGLPQRALG